jgi:periplasmic divalent cation tolerance protein
MSDLVIVLTTMPDDARSDELARALIDERLAACVNVHGPMTSSYRWNGRVERDPERQIVIKTTRGRLPALESRLHALHPYDLPEWVVLGVEQAGAAYANWVASEVDPARE